MRMLLLCLLPLLSVSAWADPPQASSDSDFSGQLGIQHYRNSRGKDCMRLGGATLCESDESEPMGGATEYRVNVPAPEVPSPALRASSPASGRGEGEGQESRCLEAYRRIPNRPPDSKTPQDLCAGVSDAGAAITNFKDALHGGMDGATAVDFTRHSPDPQQAIACWPQALTETHDTSLATKLCRNSMNAFNTLLCYREKMRTLVPAQTQAAIEACSGH